MSSLMPDSPCIIISKTRFFFFFFSHFNISKIGLHLMIHGIQFIFSVIFFSLIQKIMVGLKINDVLRVNKT